MNEIIMPGDRLTKQPAKKERAAHTIKHLADTIKSESMKSFTSGGLRFAESMIVALRAHPEDSYTTDEMISLIELIKNQLTEHESEVPN